MQGTLWRQRIGTTRGRRQLTDGPGYDSEPDWSPDGGRIVVCLLPGRRDRAARARSRRRRATHPLVANGAVNLDGRWSPDGRRVAFVSTAYEGRCHVFVAGRARRRRATEPVRLTEDHDSGLPRYYYIDVRSLSLSRVVAGRPRDPPRLEPGPGLGHGRDLAHGGTPRGAPMTLVREEETNWKAHPDWAPDGKRVAYSSYLGRQRNQLWLTTAGGGHPFELTYCDCDHTRPRWSRDGRRIAFTTNEAGDVALRVVDVPGGRAGGGRSPGPPVSPRDGDAPARGGRRVRARPAGPLLGHRADGRS